MLYFLKSSDCVIPVPLQYADFQQKTASKTCFMKCCLHTHMFCHFQRGVFFKHTSSKKILHCLWSCWCSFCWWWHCRWMYEIRVIRIWRWIIWKWRASSSNRPSKRKCCLKRPKNKRWQVIKHIVKVTNQRSRNKKVRIKMKKRGQSTCYSRFHCSVKYHWSYGWCTTGWIFGSFSWHQYLHAPNTQTNLHATQYLEAHPDLSPHYGYRRWQLDSTTEIKQFLSLYLLTGIIKKPVIHQY